MAAILLLSGCFWLILAGFGTNPLLPSNYSTEKILTKCELLHKFSTGQVAILAMPQSNGKEAKRSKTKGDN
jgi:hypothetical protein